MADRNPSRALGVVHRIEMMCDFIENPAIQNAVQQAVPVTLPRAPGALGFDIPLWVGLGTVGLWAALDAFAERASLPSGRCGTCGRECIPKKYAAAVQGDEREFLEELEDLRHLYAHNYAGEADDEYFGRRRHVFAPGIASALVSGGRFDGSRVHLDLPHLRRYAHVVQGLMARFP